jgi:hypothetical protein
MKPGELDLEIIQGSTYRQSFRWEVNGDPVDLTDWAARMQVRRKLKDTKVLIELTTENGGIEFEPTEGRFNLYLSAEDTAALNFTTAVYDIEFIAPNGDVCRLMQGVVELSKEVTR